MLASDSSTITSNQQVYSRNVYCTTIVMLLYVVHSIQYIHKYRFLSFLQYSYIQTRVISNDGFLLWFLQAIVAAHSNAPAESNAVCRRHAGELHTEGRYFEDNWCPPQNPIDPESARLSALFHDVGNLSREENVRKAIEVCGSRIT